MARERFKKSSKSINWKSNVENVQINMEKYVWHSHLYKNLIFTSLGIYGFFFPLGTFWKAKKIYF